MKIERNGKQYELTPEELFLAYTEQEHIWDVSSCQANLESYDEESFREEFGIGKDEARSKLDDIAYEMRRQIDKYDLDFDYARDCAFREILAQFA